MHARFHAQLLAFRSFRAVTRAFEPWLWQRSLGDSCWRHRPVVFGVPYPRLGDHWVALTHLRRVLEISPLRHCLSTYSNRWGNSAELRTERRKLIEQIADLLGMSGLFEITDADPEIYLPVHPPKNGRALPLALPAESEKRYVCWQFDGVTHSHLNPSDEEVESFLALFSGQPLRRLGLPLSLHDSARLLQNARVLLCVSSGMSHVAASARVPTLLFRKPQATWQQELELRKHLARWNPYPGTHFFSSTEELRELIVRLGLNSPARAKSPVQWQRQPAASVLHE